MLSVSEARVLAALAVNPAHAFTARDIATESGVSAPTVRATARWLAYAGLASQVKDYPGLWRITSSGQRVLRLANTDFPAKPQRRK